LANIRQAKTIFTSDSGEKYIIITDRSKIALLYYPLSLALGFLGLLISWQKWKKSHPTKNPTKKTTLEIQQYKLSRKQDSSYNDFHLFFSEEEW